jgi:2-methylisocitrate lyase-like PEP mutase family enzyme
MRQIGKKAAFTMSILQWSEFGRPKKQSATAALYADCLYAPGFKEREHIKAIVDAVAPKPVNILIGGAIGLTMQDAESLGARRVSVGGAFARAAWGGFIRAAKELREKGSFNELANAAPHAELQEFFSGAEIGPPG